MYLQPTGKNQRTGRRWRWRSRSKKSPVRDWAGLHNDILSCIFRKLTVFDILWKAQAVCHSWRQVALQPHVWRRIDMRNHPVLHHWDLEKLAMEAFARSGGLVEEFYAEDFGSDDLLSHMADRTTGLRCLVLISPSYNLSTVGLSGFLGGFLEILELTNFRALQHGQLGPSLLGLKCFCLNNKWNMSTWKAHWTYNYHRNNKESINYFNKEALEIAKGMPNLIELQLIGNMMTNMGLNAIIDNCPHLEFLDIRECYNVSLDEFMKVKLGKIKTMRLPQDPIEKKQFHWNQKFRVTSSYRIPSYDESDYDYDCDDYDCDDYDFRVSSWEGTGLKLQRKAYATVHSLW